MTRELPISAVPSVALAILECRKTEDRRPCKRPVRLGRTQAGDPLPWVQHSARGIWYGGDSYGPCSPLGAPGDLLYVRERASVLRILDEDRRLILSYEADGVERVVEWPERIKRPTVGHRLSGGCYREAARIWLRVEDVWVERVQDITEAGALAEGCVYETDTPRREFARLWNSIYAGRGLGWLSNCWVWACRFSVASTTGRPA